MFLHHNSSDTVEVTGMLSILVRLDIISNKYTQLQCVNEENLNTFLKAVWEVTNSQGTQESQGETPVMSFTLSTKRRLGRMASACNPSPKVRDVEGLRQGRLSDQPGLHGQTLR